MYYDRCGCNRYYGRGYYGGATYSALYAGLYLAPYAGIYPYAGVYAPYYPYGVGYYGIY